MTAHDIMNEKELKQYYEDLIDNMICGYALHKAIYDDNGDFCSYRYVDVNKKYEDLLNISKKEVIGKTIFEVFPNTDRHWIDIFARVVKNKISITYENYHTDSDKYFLTHAWSPKKGYFSCTFFDITENKEQFNELKKSEERYLELIESQNALIVRIDKDGKLTLVNDSYCKEFGKKREDIIGTDFAPKIHPDDIEETKETMKILMAPPYRSRMKQRAWTPSGWKWISWEDQVIFDKMGQLNEIQAIGYDITEIIKVHDDLERSNKDLENFAHIASHDLQEPLRKITAFENLLSENIVESKGFVNEESKLYLKKINEAAFRMKGLIEDLLSYSRISRKENDFTTEHTKAMLDDLLENELEERIKTINPEININILNCTMDCDPIQIKQLFQNLISNSMKFRDKNKKLVIGISAEKLENNKQCKLTFRDNGIGFDQKYEDDIFRSFQKLHSKDEYPGSGIGLAICKRIVERHGWKISALSKEGEGAEFSIIYPISNGDCCNARDEKQSNTDCGR